MPSNTQANELNSTLEDQLCYLLSSAHRNIQGNLDGLLKSEDLSVEQWRILSVLSDGKGHTMGRLAVQSLLNHPALTKKIDKMIMRALVHRKHDQEDHRRVLVYISDFGRELVARGTVRVDDFQSALEERLGSGRAGELRQLLLEVIGESH